MSAQYDQNPERRASNSKTPSESRADLSRGQLTTAPNSLDLARWLPPKSGIVPRIRIGSRWVSILWALPFCAALLIAAVPIAQELRTLPAVQAFIQAYPGDVDVAVLSGFPLWVRLSHFFNLFLIFFIIRSGIQILADHPRVYWNRNCVPGSEWFRFQHEVPLDRMWTSKDDSVEVPRWLGLPGVRHTVGLARKWHFFVDLLWLANGLIFYVMLFSTDQWRRLVPASWSVFPQALSAAIQYASLDFPANHGWTRFNGLQQLAYFITVFVAPLLALITGLMQSPAISNKIGWVGRTFHRQIGRTIHFFVLCWFVLFIASHVTMVFVTGLRMNLNHMFRGSDTPGYGGLWVFCVAMLFVAAAWLLASPLTLKHARWIQRAGEDTGGWLKGLGELWNPTNQFPEKDISSYFWANGTMPVSEEYAALAGRNFADYALRIGGLVEKPSVFSYSELKAMPRQEQITEHFCIQGWSGVAKWGGVPMRRLLELVKPRPEARYAVFYSFADGAEGGRYYDAHRLENMLHTLTILAYEMNGEPLSVVHGAPLRLRVENELGFKMVKWIESIEFVEDFRHLGAGCGGYNEDHEFYGYREPI